MRTPGFHKFSGLSLIEHVFLRMPLEHCEDLAMQERCVAEIRRTGGRASASELDYVLWNRGQQPEIKARLRHRTHTTFY